MAAPFFFFNDAAPPEIYPLSLPDALPIWRRSSPARSATSRRPRSRERRLRTAERSEEHTSELQSQSNLVCRLLLEKKKALTSHVGALWHERRGHVAVHTRARHLCALDSCF